MSGKVEQKEYKRCFFSPPQKYTVVREEGGEEEGGREKGMATDRHGGMEGMGGERGGRESMILNCVPSHT